MTKEELRSRVGLKRKELDEATVEKCSARIQERIIAMEAFTSADVVACYMAIGGEVMTDSVVSVCREAGKTVCMPAYREDVGAYRMVVMDYMATIGDGPLKVPEPVGGDVFSLGSVDMILVPGIAFDLSGRRVGRGGGHYDALLSSEENKALKLGLAYEFQVFDKVPSWEMDVNMDLVVTEDRVVDC